MKNITLIILRVIATGNFVIGVYLTNKGEYPQAQCSFLIAIIFLLFFITDSKED